MELLRFDRKNNVGLVDEYDMINRDINPYRGYSPKTLVSWSFLPFLFLCDLAH
jgi:hypothetical protein